MFSLHARRLYCCRRILKNYATRCYATQGITSFTENTELTAKVKHDIENHWRDKLKKVDFDASQPDSKYVVVPMFPYPSGSLHLGHVRVYTISDTMARFNRLNGKNVLHPIGWDAFGLPAENAAIERNIPPNEWTKQNIEHMRMQLDRLGCSFDWSRELATCDPKYYKWTQWIFLQMFKDGLAYQKEAVVNWDPIDQTVLANEQVDANGCSWRSGAIVEKKMLKQWFIRSTKFAKQLYDGLDDPMLEDWDEIKKIQRNWIGKPNGYSFALELLYLNDTSSATQLKNITVWTERPEEMKNPGFIAIKSDHALNDSKENFHLLDITAKNPFNEGSTIPIIVCDDVEYQHSCDTYLGVPIVNARDKEIAENLWLKCDETKPTIKHRESIIKKAKSKNIGGYLVSSRVQDWLISRQRYWGTPIPIVHCSKCGPVAVPGTTLPIILPEVTIDEAGKPIPLAKRDDWLQTVCPKCKNSNAMRESDTMDTFFDSSWYFLRYLDPNDNDKIFNKNLAKKMMPVDLYIGGIEHAVLHLYIARFVMQYLYNQNLVPSGEPFKRLLVQGMINGRTYLARDGRFLKEDEVSVLNEKQNRAEEIDTGMPVQMQWEKMSKSKKNGIDPLELFAEYSVDTIRLIMLADSSPRSSRNWSKLTFPGIIKWQHRIWLCLTEFNQIRQDESIAIASDAKYIEAEKRLFESKNFEISNATENYKHLHFQSTIKNLQCLSDALRKAPKNIVKYSVEYETALANLIVMLAPIAPHFASELWSKFLAIPNRCEQKATDETTNIEWTKDVLEQTWPTVSKHFQYRLDVRINNKSTILRIPRTEVDTITKDLALKKANELDDFKKTNQTSNIIHIKFSPRDGICSLLSIIAEPKDGKKKNSKKKQNIDDDDAQISEMN